MPQPVEQGKAFERRVADAYRALGYRVVADASLEGVQVDLLAYRAEPGSPPTVLAVECKDSGRSLGKREVLSFVQRMTAHRERGLISSAALVSAGGFTVAARQVGDDHPYLRLLSWEELSEDTIDLRLRMQALVGDYEASGANDHYLPLSTELVSWTTLAPAHGDSLSLEDLLARWRDPSEPAWRLPTSVFVVGDFGSGKTTLLRNFQYDRSKAYITRSDHRIPLFVALRHFHDTQDVMTLLRNSFRDTYHRDLGPDALNHYLRSGLFYLLLDGFDEMVERSDTSQRLDHFYRLFPLLRTESRTILTSRPSYFVGRGEFEDLLGALTRQAASVTDVTFPVNGGGLPSGRLRRQLLARHRDLPLETESNDSLSPSATRAFRLAPLTSSRILDFLRSYETDLHAVGASSDAVWSFIERTYDLTDLASRPLLLTLIIDSVRVRGLDVHSTTLQYGAAGLYEIYTDTKLRLDLAKGKTRQRGLTAEVRRLLAEALAIHMYEANVLEVSFEELLSGLLVSNDQVKQQLASTRLAVEEIETDFATCSFVTLNEHGNCRFVHKSFRGFFVARVLKQHLPRLHPLLNEHLEQEVLYFLGGFVPTEPALGEQLWSLFVRSPPDEIELRRNALVSYLYSKPEHEGRRIDGAGITDASFTRLRFRRAPMGSSSWRNCTLNHLQLDEVTWQATALLKSRVSQLDASRSKLDIRLDDTTFETARFGDGSEVHLEAIGSTIGPADLNASSLFLHGNDLQTVSINLERSMLACSGFGGTSEQIVATDSRVTVGAAWSLGLLRATNSALTLDRERLDEEIWDLHACVVRLMLADSRLGSMGRGRLTLRIESSVDDRSVLFPSPGAVQSLLDMPCGVFGALDTSLDVSALLHGPRAWGVLDAGPLLSERHLLQAENAQGWRCGDLLLVTSDWYSRELSDSGRLSAVSRLMRLATESPHQGNPFSRTLLSELLAESRNAHRELFAEDWPDLDMKLTQAKSP